MRYPLVTSNGTAPIGLKYYLATTNAFRSPIMVPYDVKTPNHQRPTTLQPIHVCILDILFYTTMRISEAYEIKEIFGCKVQVAIDAS